MNESTQCPNCGGCKVMSCTDHVASFRLGRRLFGTRSTPASGKCHCKCLLCEYEWDWELGAPPPLIHHRPDLQARGEQRLKEELDKAEKETGWLLRLPLP
jgi:hypothetical protein